MRSPALIRHIDQLDPKAWKTVRLDRDGNYKKPQVVDETVRLSNYPHPIRQLVVRGLGRESPTVLITNHSSATPKFLIERYARRMTIEQRLAEAIRAFHLDSLASSVPLNVDLDIVLSVLASTICAALRKRLPGYHTATPDTLQRRFLQTGGVIHTTNDTITVRPTAAPTRPSCAQPTSPTPPSPGGATANSTSNTRKSRVDLAARKSALGTGQPGACVAALTYRAQPVLRGAERRLPVRRVQD